MKISIKELRQYVREQIDCWGGSRPDEMYNEEIIEDDTWKARSVFVPDDIKVPIRRWLIAMGLSTGTKRST